MCCWQKIWNITLAMFCANLKICFCCDKHMSMCVIQLCAGYWHMTMQGKGHLTLSAGANKTTWLYIYHFVITYLLQGEFCCRGSYHKTWVVIIKKGENVEAYQVDREILMMDKQLWWFYLCYKFWYFCVILDICEKPWTHTQNTYISRLDLIV